MVCVIWVKLDVSRSPATFFILFLCVVISSHHRKQSFKENWKWPPNSFSPSLFLLAIRSYFYVVDRQIKNTCALKLFQKYRNTILEHNFRYNCVQREESIYVNPSASRIGLVFLGVGPREFDGVVWNILYGKITA